MSKKSAAARHILTAAIITAAFFAADAYMTYNNFIENSDYFAKNDFEITRCAHPEKVWDKVFFGNSVVISSYIEEGSSSGYINLGLDYGVVTDLRDMLNKKFINIGSDLVIGLNYLTLYDDFETNPTYIWHKRPYEPYAYFERDRFYPIITGGFDNILNLQSPMPMKYGPQSKSVYHGMVSDAAMEEKLAEYEEEFFTLPIEKFSKNISALEEVLEYCRENNIRARIVWMPWNPKFEKPELLLKVKNAANTAAARFNIEILDLEDELPETDFYDTGHLNYEVGSPRFTHMIDQWLGGR
ncbi:MAG: hypothetical protein PUF72_09245 [Clostridiales bacterium]|nr:hypothetical protein [Clostridiales bacterium]